MRKCPFFKNWIPFQNSEKGGKEGNGVVMRMSVQKQKLGIVYYIFDVDIG